LHLLADLLFHGLPPLILSYHHIILGHLLKELTFLDFAHLLLSDLLEKEVLARLRVHQVSTLVF
jgi:hypothetical protein